VTAAKNEYKHEIICAPLNPIYLPINDNIINALNKKKYIDKDNIKIIFS